VDGLGDHGWEVSHGSQIELFAVVGTVVLGGADRGRGGATDIAGLWNVGNVTVELGRDGRELETGSRGVVEGGLAGAAPVGWHTGDGVHAGGSSPYQVLRAAKAVDGIQKSGSWEVKERAGANCWYPPLAAEVGRLCWPSAHVPAVYSILWIYQLPLTRPKVPVSAEFCRVKVGAIRAE
jgi:hypothetical protein